MGFLDTLLGKSASKTANAAAGLQYQREQQAVQGLRNAGDSYAGGMRDLSESYAPYAGAGQPALQRLMSGLGLGGDQQGFINSYRALPGYQAGLDAGARTLERSAAARSGVQNGALMKGLTRFASDYEDQRAGDYMSRLAALMGTGLAATGQQVGTAGAGLQGQLGAEMAAAGSSFKSAGTEPMGMVAGAQAQQNALQNLLGTAAYLGGSWLGRR